MDIKKAQGTLADLKTDLVGLNRTLKELSKNRDNYAKWGKQAGEALIKTQAKIDKIMARMAKINDSIVAARSKIGPKKTARARDPRGATSRKKTTWANRVATSTDEVARKIDEDNEE